MTPEQFADHHNLVIPHGLSAEKVIAAQFRTRKRIAQFLAREDGFTGDQATVYVDAVLRAPFHIDNGNGTMSPIDWSEIGRASVNMMDTQH